MHSPEQQPISLSGSHRYYTYGKRAVRHTVIPCCSLRKGKRVDPRDGRGDTSTPRWIESATYTYIGVLAIAAAVQSGAAAGDGPMDGRVRATGRARDLDQPARPRSSSAQAQRLGPAACTQMQQLRPSDTIVITTPRCCAAPFHPPHGSCHQTHCHSLPTCVSCPFAFDTTRPHPSIVING